MADQKIRSEALERAVYLAAHQQIEKFDGELVLRIARSFESYLSGKEQKTNA
ncbi:hypothetical protein SEA_CECE_306 [Microbacterium phage Cece]|nr:hypothetical protein SEA_CECE_3 [Microbacterium phage Cece]UVG35312.1 hypothetical protein SEA_CECE_306 [Microbacterium phage Cece]